MAFGTYKDPDDDPPSPTPSRCSLASVSLSPRGESRDEISATLSISIEGIKSYTGSWSSSSNSTFNDMDMASHAGDDCRNNDQDLDPAARDPDSDSDVSVAIIEPTTVWSDLWNISQEEAALDYPLRLPTDVPLPGAPAPGAKAAEHLAYNVCRRGSCSIQDFCALAALLPEQSQVKRRQNSTSDGAAGGLQRVFLTGAYSIGGGGLRGVQTNTGLFPWLTTWLASVVRGAKEDHRFSSCAFLVNTLHYVHRDTGNAPGTSNLLIPCNRWKGGQLWQADVDGSVRLEETDPPES
ncbi:unnamed protein product [Symbiodinium sp. CCMP2592]|nr:unnamed protein product [Symbiodinium sp. CCMP2592]